MKKLFESLDCFSRKAKRRKSEAPKVAPRPMESLASSIHSNFTTKSTASQREFGRQEEEYIGDFVPEKQKLGPTVSTNTYIIGPGFNAAAHLSGNDHDRHHLSNKVSFKSIVSEATYFEGGTPPQYRKPTVTRRPSILSDDDDVFPDKANDNLYWT